MDKKLKLAPFVIKRYEPKSEKYFFYNAKNKTYWDTDKLTGYIIVTLDGSLSTKEVIKILSANNTEIPVTQLEDYFYQKFDYLLQEEFLCVEN